MSSATNARGAKSANPKKAAFGFAKGKRVIVAGDADKPGQEGAKRFAAEFYRADADDLRNVQVLMGKEKRQGGGNLIPENDSHPLGLFPISVV